ncbi:MAG: ArsR family transcriptional regulator [Verrucomicrobia bacterium]|nr:ArsR family transcriptional regulator [Verrucomicrobiota bacterium]
MKESQNIEWKETWRDEFLHWICGFANAEGGVLHIGRNARGVVVGVPDAARLLEEIPNKVRDILGILVEVNLRKEKGKEFLEIVVEPYPYPISYKGEYHYRSGSTKQELKGAALDRFLLRKQGRTWDGVPVPRVSARDLSRTAIAAFRRQARASRRLDASVLRESVAGLLDKLNLLDGGQLKRAAVLLFHPDPERFITGAFVKIGFFHSESELLYHDEVHGDLFSQTQKTMELLVTKYLKAAISYQGIHRVETLPVPEAALREAVLNAIIHKDYASGAPVQIRVYGDRLKLWNAGELPDHWSVEDLLRTHASRPFNPSVANAFFRAGAIEAWGRGVQRILDACVEAGTPAPEIRYQPGDLWLEFAFAPEYLAILPGDSGDASRGGRLGEKLGEKLGETRAAIIQAMQVNPKVTTTQLAQTLRMSTTAVDKHLRFLRNQGLIKRTGPAKGGHWEVLP